MHILSLCNLLLPFMEKITVSRTVRTAAWSVLLGGAAGFALGLLIAPERGQKARRRLAYQLEHLAERTGRIVQGLFGSEVSSEARRTGDALVADAQARADHIRSDIEALLREIRAQESAARKP